MKSGYDWIHECLDAERAGGEPSRSHPEKADLEEYRRALALLESTGEGAPPGFTRDVLAALPNHPPPRRARGLWDRCVAHWRWAVPVLAGATAALALVAGTIPLGSTPTEKLVPVTFEFHAPGAERVEIVGSFTNWQPEKIKLEGPDKSGHWTTTVELPTGLHEYLFLVDGKDWQADPNAVAFRPDGFGNENALLEI